MAGLANLERLASIFYIQDEGMIIGGEGEIVEIDECYVVKRKYNQGRALKSENEIIGGIARKNNTECFIEIASDRSKSTLHDVLKEGLSQVILFIVIIEKLMEI